jgi:hypothetical protein
MRYYFLLLVLFSVGVQAQNVISINGYAPGFKNEKVAFYEYEDYISFSTKKIGEASIKEDSTFSITLYTDTIKKVKVAIKDYYFHFYLDPGSNYNVVISGALGSMIESGIGLDLDYYFVGLDTNDINYKILQFDQDLFAFLNREFNQKSRSSGDFALALDQFKTEIEQKIDKEIDLFFLTYIRFSLAQIDDLPFKGSRNRYEKYDFYIKPSNVWYNNDRYMEYIYQYYKGYYQQLSKKVNQLFYEGIIHSSPTMLMHALSGDYALHNLKLRELVIIRMLSEMYYKDDVPQTNVRVVLDSLANYALFIPNRVVAQNILSRVSSLSKGSACPTFSLNDIGGNKLTKNTIYGKYTYIHFMDFSKLAKGDFTLLVKLHEKYGEYINFLTIVKQDSEINPDVFLTEFNVPEKLGDNWHVVIVNPEHYIFDRFNIVSFPYYISLDDQTNIEAAPALSPRPNNEYETIERFLFHVKKSKSERK